jgi:ribosomal protein S18 acetylase RimI-like enzyme
MRGESSVSSLHWLVMKEQYQGNGLGRALSAAVMNIFAEHDAFPVYIHTQPWSWKAILLYASLGFRIQKTDSFSTYVNQYREAMNTLKGLLPEDQYRMLENTAEE